MPIDTSEIRRGLAAARPFLLSHHDPTEWNRCYSLTLSGWHVRLCGRCSGIYPGILLGLFALTAPGPLLLVALLPLPALVDWTVTAFTRADGYNAVRTATGAVLGVGYALGLRRLFLQGDGRVLAVGAGYALLAAVLLALRAAKE